MGKVMYNRNGSGKHESKGTIRDMRRIVRKIRSRKARSLRCGFCFFSTCPIYFMGVSHLTILTATNKAEDSIWTYCSSGAACRETSNFTLNLISEETHTRTCIDTHVYLVYFYSCLCRLYYMYICLISFLLFLLSFFLFGDGMENSNNGFD